MHYILKCKGGGWREAAFIALAVVVLVTIALGQSGCGGSSATSDSPSSATAGEPVVGGTLNVGCQPVAGTWDPHLMNENTTYKVNAQVFSWLVTLSPEFEVAPDIATKWEPSADSKTWTFTIRTDAKFSNGDPVTADDVVYSFNRMRDPKVGAVNESVFLGVTSVTSPDPTHVVFEMKEPNPEFPKDAAEFHAMILSKSVKDPGTESVGSGAFMVKEYKPEDRVVLVPNPYYYGKDANGTQLPYLDSIVYQITPEEAGSIDGLLGGQLDLVQGLSAAAADRVKAESSLRLITNLGNELYKIHMRSDPGHPAEDSRVRLALRMGTDYQGLIDIVRPGLSVVGNGTVVGPVYGADYWDHAPKYDPEGAKRLLAEAGKSNLKLTLYTANYSDMPDFAVAWKEQMKKIDVNVEVVNLPDDVFYATGKVSWLECDWGQVNWAMRVKPITLFQITYLTDAVWNTGHWSDPEFDAVCAEIASEADEAKRAELYHQAQQILWERGPDVVTSIMMGVVGVRKTVMNYEPNPDNTRTLLTEVWLTK